jgi:hypothetical protein
VIDRFGRMGVAFFDFADTAMAVRNRSAARSGWHIAYNSFL